MTLSTGEFMRRFLLHVLPRGFHRIRHYGLIAKTRELLNVPPDVDDEAGTGDSVIESSQPTFVCPDCGATMIIIETLVRGQPIRAQPQLRGTA